MAINHDNDYHGDINYGNLYPEDWYWFDTSDEDNQEVQQEGEKELLPIEDVIDFGKGRFTSAKDQQSTWYQGPQ